VSQPAGADELKTCCAAVYQSDFARLLLGDSFHPGGLRLTEHVGGLLDLKPGVRLLDIASGKGESAIYLAGKFGCEVVGIDFGATNVQEASQRAAAAGVAALVTFAEGDAERLAFPAASFDAILCECAFCTFPDKPAAAAEFARVLRPGGRIGLSDLTRSGPLPKELEGLLAWIACIADARPVAEYVAYLEAAGFTGVQTEEHDAALAGMVRDIQGKLMGAELMVKLRKIQAEGVDFNDAKSLARAAAGAVRAKTLGYGVITGKRV
jgi:ubiquinone/menaquinone biosynthesis C-methylase UbiE